MVTSYLKDLVDAGAYDRELMLAYARQTKHERSIERLENIPDGFDRTVSTTSHRRWDL
jgi:hypothetical protein